MGIEFDVWPPDLVEAIRPRAEILARTYGAAIGPVLDHLAGEVRELAGGTGLRW